MPYYKFGKNDIFLNRIQAHPKVKFLTWSGSVYYNNTSQTSSNPNIPNGHINLHEINVNRGGGVDRPDDNLIYPFITKQGSLTSFKTVSTSQFNTDFNYGDIISSSYPMTASISRDYYIAPSTRSRIQSLRNSLNYYSRLNPHYQYSSSLLGRDLATDELSLISIPSIFYGSLIKKGSVKLSFYVTGTLIAEAKDENRDGSLIQTGPIDSIGSGSTAGIVLYNEGFLVLTGTNAIGIDKSHQEVYIAAGAPAGAASNPKWVHFNSLGDSYDRIASSSFNLEFEGTNYIPTVTMLAHAPKAALNNSSNPTFIQSGQTMNVNTGSGVSYEENPSLKIKNIVKSPYSEHTASFQKQTYISKIGIYDKDRNLIGIAKLANPVKKTEDLDYTFKLKLDF
jgi:hypothetical protein